VGYSSITLAMKLPHPLAKQLAGCCWLARHVAKTRVFLRGELPFAAAARVPSCKL